jgi:putative CocE/NonD family hydrolase
VSGMESEHNANACIPPISLRLQVKVPLRNGLHLSATVYHLDDETGPRPCVLMLTPYVADTHHSLGVYFSKHGLPVAIVDSRGRGDSEGEYLPYIHEAEDGYDAVEWLAQQPYCNGQVAMYGGSYLGYVQWVVAGKCSPHLATIVPTAAPCLGVDVPMRNNIFYPFLLRWLCLVNGRASQKTMFSDASWWSGLFRQWRTSGASFLELDKCLGRPSLLFRDWLQHPEPAAYWDKFNPTSSQYGQIDIPILTITGIYDDDQPGALEHYRQHMLHAPPAARTRHFLIIGPWDHSGTQLPRERFGGITLELDGVIDIYQLHLEWYEWVMRLGARPAFLQKPVAYYVMGGGKWRYADSLDAVTSHHLPLYLDSTGLASDLYSAGFLKKTSGVGSPDSYTYDPRELGGPEIEAEACITPETTLIDQTVAHALAGKMLVYHTTPFDADTTIAGFFQLKAWIAIDCPDTDFYVSVHEIDPAGGSVRLSGDAIRARYRGGLREGKLIGTRAPLVYVFERFTFVARVVKRGHRLRLIVSPVGRLIDEPFSQRNFNAGGCVAMESVENAKPVTVVLHHDADHPSALYVPMSEPQLPREHSQG